MKNKYDEYCRKFPAKNLNHHGRGIGYDAGLSKHNPYLPRKKEPSPCLNLFILLIVVFIFLCLWL